MEKINFENDLFVAIKKDDLKSFSSLMKSNSDLNICYGRFPILSLLYLYSSFKILAKYEKLLMPIHNYKIIQEKFEIYKDFKKRARKTIRFFEEEKIVYPVLMLAVLNEKIMLNANFKFLYKNEEILQILSKIYKINYNLDVSYYDDKIKISNSMLSQKTKILFSVILAICAIIVTFSSVLIGFVSNSVGLGSDSRPIKIHSGQEFVQALKNGDRNYVVENDIVISGGNKTEKFSGFIDFNGHTLTIDGDINASLITNLTGKITGMKIKLTENNIKITQNCAIISENSSGIIENCEISGKFSGEFSSDGDAFFGLFVAENNGEITNSKIAVSGNVLNQNETNAYFSYFAGVNRESGKINYSSISSGVIVADTVDIAGVCAQNYGEISYCENNATLSQSSSKQWHPNVAGIVMSNYGKVSNCTNNGELNAKSTVDGEDVFYVFVAGIACENYSDIENCENYGYIEGSGEVSNVVAGGIASQNIKNDSYEASIENSYSKNDFKLFSNLGQVAVGGVVGVNSSIVLSSGFSGNIDANSTGTENKQIFTNKIEKAVVVFAGGVVGVSQDSVVQKCYATVKFINKVASTETLKLYGGVIGSVGIVKFKLGTRDYAGTYDDVSGKEYMGSALNYIVSNYYVTNESIDENAFGIFAVTYQSGNQLYYAVGEMNKISNDFLETIFQKNNLINACSSLDEIKTKLELVYE